MRIHVVNFVLAGYLIVPVCLAQLRAPDERAVWELWKNHVEDPSRHATLAAASRKAAESAASDPLSNFARGLEAWHLLKQEKHAEARRLLETILKSRPDSLPAFSEASAAMARTWLTRLDREQVKTALKRYYADHIEYPPSLAALEKAAPGINWPRTDRWNRPWDYRLVALLTLPDMKGQKYQLASTRLGGDSELDKALEREYASGVRLEPAAIVSGTAGRETVRFKPAGDDADSRSPILLSPGGESDGIMFAYMGSHILILTDGNHWNVMPRPR